MHQLQCASHVNLHNALQVNREGLPVVMEFSFDDKLRAGTKGADVAQSFVTSQHGTLPAYHRTSSLKPARAARFPVMLRSVPTLVLDPRQFRRGTGQLSVSVVDQRGKDVNMNKNITEASPPPWYIHSTS